MPPQLLARVAAGRSGREGEAESDRSLLRRFVALKQQDAFDALLRRHGPMVWGVCRRVLRDAHEAEDAFQATFLVLVRKSRSIRRPELLGNWLYGVAYRTALKAKSKAGRRREYGRQAEAMTSQEPGDEAAHRELRTLLDEELCRLPESYRAPLVLCYLEGCTHEQAARQLGWPIGSMSRRLGKARQTLRARLARRGLAVSAGLLALLLSRSGSAAVPAGLSQSTVQAAWLIAAGKAEVAEVASSSVVELVEEMLGAMRCTSWKCIALILLVLLTAVLMVGVGESASASRGATGAAGVHGQVFNRRPPRQLSREELAKHFPNEQGCNSN